MLYFNKRVNYACLTNVANNNLKMQILLFKNKGISMYKTAVIIVFMGVFVKNMFLNIMDLLCLYC